MAIQQGNAVVFQNTMSTEWIAVTAVGLLCLIFSLQALYIGRQK